MEQVLDTLLMRQPDIIKIFEHYGEAHQLFKVAEELSECAARISKDCVNEIMNDNSDIDLETGAFISNEAFSEMADALIMLIQIASINPQRVSEFIDFKLDRILKVIRKG